MLNKKALAAVSCALAVSACTEKKTDAPKEVDAGASTAAVTAPAKKTYKALSRVDFE